MLFFLKHSLVKNLRITMHANMRVGDNDHQPSALIYLLLHFVKVFFGEPHWIKFEVFEFVSVANIQPEGVDGNFVVCKITVPLHDLLC